MTLGIWAPLVADDAHEAMKANVHRAVGMGVEQYGAALGELTNDLMMSPTMQALMSGLVVGAIAFDVKAGCELEMDGGFVLTIKVEQR